MLSDPMVDEAPDKMVVASGILNRLPISGLKVNTKLHRSVHNALINETSASKDILYVLLLGE